MKSKMDFISVYCSMADIAMLLKQAEIETGKEIELTQELLEQILIEHYGFDKNHLVYNEELETMTFYSVMTCLHKPRESNEAVKCQRFDGKERYDNLWLSSGRASNEVWWAVKGG